MSSTESQHVSKNVPKIEKSKFLLNSLKSVKIETVSHYESNKNVCFPKIFRKDPKTVLPNRMTVSAEKNCDVLINTYTGF